MNSIFKCTPPPKRNNRKGFTLSETLIAVAILGLLAAIVIPNMFRAYQQYQMVSKLKVAYALLNDVVDQAEIENGPISNWEVAGKTPTFIYNRYFAPYLKVSKNCGYGSNTVGEANKNNWCFFGKNGRWLDLAGREHTGTAGATDFHKVILKNGMSLGVRGAGAGGVTANTNNRIYIAVDIDGNKGKGIAGKDVFFFTVVRGDLYQGSGASYGIIQKSQLYPGTIHPYAIAENADSSWRFRAHNITANDRSVKSHCSKDSTKFDADNHSATYTIFGGVCANAIIYNGWKIPSWYPW